jgi:hypothetical protein
LHYNIKFLHQFLPYFILCHFALIGGGLPQQGYVHFFPIDGKNEPKKILKKLSPASARQAINARGHFFRPPLSGAHIPLRIKWVKT